MKIFLLTFVIAVVAVSGVMVQTINGLNLSGEEMMAIEGLDCNTCDGAAQCTQCEITEGGAFQCSSGALYVECLDTKESGQCGTCATMGSDCGDYLECSGPGCVGCQATGTCDGCSAVENANPC